MRSIDILAEVNRVLTLEGQAILDCVEKFKDPRFSEPLKRALMCFHHSLERGGKIIVTGVGKSGKIGQKIAATFCSTGSLAVFIHPTEGLHGDLGLIRPEDSVLALSYTGNTDEIMQLVPSFKRLGVSLVGIGGNPSSRLAAECMAWIQADVKSEACPHNLAPTTSTTLTLALGDAIAVALMQLKGFEAASFAHNHPGGSLGKKLNLRVKDLMQKGGAVPVVGPQDSIDDVIVVSTRGKQGAVLVAEGKKLLGIITDGDIRRSLQHREKFFQLKAHDVMTQNPVTVQSEMLAQAALDLMENRPSQISVLPVVNASGQWEGLIRLHDIVKAF